MLPIKAEYIYYLFLYRKKLPLHGIEQIFSQKFNQDKIYKNLISQKTLLMGLIFLENPSQWQLNNKILIK